MLKRVFVALALGLNFAHAEIIQTDQFSNMTETILSEMTDETLVIFDVDDVLIIPTDDFNTQSELRQRYKKELGRKHGRENIKKILSDFFVKREVQLLDKEMPAFIQTLREKKAHVACLTAWWTGPFGTIERMEDLRFKSFDEMGLDFKDISPFKDNVSFPDRKTRNGTPMIMNGMILTALSPKGDILGLALDTLNHKYKKVIFVDDRYDFLQSVQGLCQERNIEFVGINYTKASTLEGPKHDEAKEIERFKILEEEHVWLTDKELEKRAQKKSAWHNFLLLLGLE